MPFVRTARYPVLCGVSLVRWPVVSASGKPQAPGDVQVVLAAGAPLESPAVAVGFGVGDGGVGVGVGESGAPVVDGTTLGEVEGAREGRGDADLSVPEQAVESSKEDVQWAKTSAQQARR